MTGFGAWGLVSADLSRHGDPSGRQPGKRVLAWIACSRREGVFPRLRLEGVAFCPGAEGFLAKRTNRRRYMAWLGEQLGFRRPKDWYSVTTADFQRHRGGALLLKYRSSVSATVRLAFRNTTGRSGCSQDADVFLEESQELPTLPEMAGDRLGYKRLDDWYDVKAADFGELRRRTPKALPRFSGGCGDRPDSAAAVVRVDVYPRAARILGSPRTGVGMSVAREAARLSPPGDWRRVHRRNFDVNGGGSLMNRYHSQWDLLEEVFPQGEWPHGLPSSHSASHRFSAGRTPITPSTGHGPTGTPARSLARTRPGGPLPRIFGPAAAGFPAG